MFGVHVNMIPREGVCKEEQVLVPVAQLDLSEIFVSPVITVSYELSRIEDKFLCKAQAEGSIKLECGRCLKTFEKKVFSSFIVEFEKRSGGLGGDPELGVSFYSGDVLPLGEEIRQELELSVPLAAVCSDECPGLCLVCGKDLNEGPCSCKISEPDRPLSNLSELLKKKKTV